MILGLRSGSPEDTLDIARMLGGEDLEQGRGQPVARECQVFCAGWGTRLYELPDAVVNHTPISLKTWFVRPPMSQPRMLRSGRTKPRTNSDIRMPIP